MILALLGIIPLARKYFKEGFLIITLIILWITFFAYVGPGLNYRHLVLLVPFIILPLNFISLKEDWIKVIFFTLFIISFFNMLVSTISQVHITDCSKISIGLDKIIYHGYMGSLFAFFQYAIGNRNRYPFRLEGYLGIIFLFFMFFSSISII